ncbi:sperm-associated antigen 7 [Octopus bimaculoides]|uniref:R3H domain-containing protein n=1 Tax=Octopus bimaculoides TaxID=37653 RepID=A0A0L8GWY4_OCTBM|nr:sperm-associated antigen 7 [Octopus bimaculoides]|eukprot:XP_014777617.1 PREDICTED: sperm-associated antigen 7-like [Octopus bimaculoides]
MDLLGSILGSMEPPPSIGDEAKKRVKEQNALLKKKQEDEKNRLEQFRAQTEKRIHAFVTDSNKQKYKWEPMDKVFRAIIHEVADVAGLTSFSFGLEEQDRYVMLWKKEFTPSDEEVLAYRRGEEWDPEKAKEIAKQKEAELQLEAESSKSKIVSNPTHNYKDKYKHLIGEEAAKDAAKQTTANKSYGFVPSENKRDSRTIEQVLADTRAKKKLKTDTGSIPDPSVVTSSSEDTAQP